MAPVSTTMESIFCSFSKVTLRVVRQCLFVRLMRCRQKKAFPFCAVFVVHSFSWPFSLSRQHCYFLHRKSREAHGEVPRQRKSLSFSHHMYDICHLKTSQQSWRKIDET